MAYCEHAQTKTAIAYGKATNLTCTYVITLLAACLLKYVDNRCIGHTLDQYHTGLRLIEGVTIGLWRHTGPTLLWVEAD